VLPAPQVEQRPPASPLPADAIKAPVRLPHAPPGAPNIVVVLLDDVGFGAAGTFGGPIPTPTLDALAKEGLRYNRFHTAAICSPTRAALLTGRNPHAVNIGAVLNTPSPYDGYNGELPRSAATVAEILRQNGYGTAAFGKWHLAPEWETSPAASHEHWPTQQGFDHFYGFLPAETDQYAPLLTLDATPVPVPQRAGYHLSEDLAQQAIAWMRAQRSLAPDKPFFVYFAPGGTHAPIQVPRPWIEKFRGQFADGYDRLRETTLARQKTLGVVPANADLTPRPKEIPAWDSLPAPERELSERLMETYAGFLAHTDAQVGKLVEALRDLEVYDNTLFIYIVGDNGSSGEGSLQGSTNYVAAIQGTPPTVAQMRARMADIGGPMLHVHYPAGWAWALDSPFQWMKQIASHLGGIRNPMVISWPARIHDQGGLREQFGYVSDLMPTLLEAAGVAAPAAVNGVAQQPIDGVSLAYTFDDAHAAGRHHTQYFQVYGNRAIYHDGWMASAFRGRAPWNVREPIARSMLDDRWELYNLDEDYSQAHDLAAKNPAKLRELQALFWAEAGRNKVLPILDNGNPELMPTLFGRASSATFYPALRGIPESQAPAFAYRSHSIEAHIAMPAGGASGVLAAEGGSTGGWSLWIDGSRRPVYTYNDGISQVSLTGRSALSSGKHRVRLTLEYAKPGTGGAANAKLEVDGANAGELRLTHTVRWLFGIAENFDVGIDGGSPVGPYPSGSAYSGPIDKVVVNLH
jgi:arylsulfatase